MVVFLGIRPGQVPEEPQPEGLDPFRDWQAACSVNRGHVKLLRDVGHCCWTFLPVSFNGNKES